MKANLSELIEYDLQAFEHDPVIEGIALNSKEIKPGYLFIALKGQKHDGADYIDEAIKNGAVAIIMENVDKAPKDPAVITLVVEDAKKRYAQIAHRLYPKQPEIIVAVTGTNGKTSTVHLVRQIWQQLHYKAASIGTIGIYENSEKLDGFDILNMTTPHPIKLHQTLHTLAERGVDHLAMEASSHGIQQNRIAEVRFRAAGFTNLTEDHLDYHGNMEEYFKAKLKLFTETMPENSVAVLNSDIKYFQALKEACTAHGHRIIEYGKNAQDIKLVKTQKTLDNVQVDIEIFGKIKQVQFQLLGEFQLYNLLCAVGLTVACGADIEHVIETIPNLKSVPGRMQKIIKADSSKHVYIDYAHTEDALEKALAAIHEFKKPESKVHLVFGCGGERDELRRSGMGKIAAAKADIVIVTDDNPRNENAAEIRKQILSYCENAKEIADRRQAIKEAIAGLASADILLIAGKGHEDYQIIGDEKLHFDDAEVAFEYM